MREVVQTVKVYKFSELDDKAKDRVRDWLYSDGYPWATEALKSLEKLAEAFGGTMTDYSIDWLNSSYSSAKFDMPDAEEIGNDNLPGDVQRAIGTSDASDEDVSAAYEKWLSAKLESLGTYDPVTLKGHGECKLTGYGHDESALDGFRQKFKGGCSDLSELMQAAFKSWHRECVADFTSYFDDEPMSESCEANEYEFTAQGKHIVI